MKTLLKKLKHFFMTTRNLEKYRKKAYKAVEEDTGEFPREDWARLIEEKESLEKPRR